MTNTEGKRYRRIEVQLPLAIAVLLVLVVGIFTWAAYREARESALEAARERLEDVGEQLASLLGQTTGQIVHETGRAADSSAIVDATTAPPGAADPAAYGIMEALAQSHDLIGAVTMWDTAGGLLLEARGRGQPTNGGVVGEAFPAWLEEERGSAGSFRVIGNEIWYDVAVAVGPEDEPPLGYLVQHRRITQNPQSVQLITDLIGMQTRFVVGEFGRTWTDLTEEVPAPPVTREGPEGPTPHLVEAGRWAVGTAVPVPQSTWHVWVELPLDIVLERPRAFLRGILPLGLAVVLVGTIGGWGVSQRITRPLGRVTDAARRLSAGDPDARVRVESSNEIGELALAFNHMAGSLQAALADVRRSESEVRSLNQDLERRVAERTRALRESEERFRMLAVTAHDGIVSADPSGHIAYFNPGAERIFGWEAEEVVGSPLETLMPDRYREEHAAGLERYRATGEARLVGGTTELIGLRRDGSEFPLELSLGSRSTGEGPAFIGIIRDITERRDAERAIHAYAAELEAINEELEAFSYSVSHDLRAPLRSIHGFSHAVLEDYEAELDERGADYLRRVCAAAERMGGLIDDLLELSRATRTEMDREDIDLSGLADEVVGDLSREQRDREIDVRIAPGLRCEGDRRLLTLVLRNLLDNAWKFTADTPRAVVEFGQVEGGEPVFFVRDNGAGFDEAYADKLFQPFQRLHKDREFSGTGVGLALVRRIIHRHGGRVWAEGKEGVGAAFFFTLPIS